MSRSRSFRVHWRSSSRFWDWPFHAPGGAALAQSLLAAQCAVAEEAKPATGAAAKITYDEHVRAIFREHCFSCHNQDKKKGDLALDSFSSTMKGASSGEVIAAGDLESSRLWAVISHADEPKMPPNQDRIPDAKLALVKAWITGGALENSGSLAKVKKQPTMDLSLTAGSAKPTGPPAMPEGISRQPLGHASRSSAVTALAASPWAPLVAVAGQKQIFLYHAETGRLLGVLPFPEGIAYVLKFSRSGSILLAGGGQGAKNGRVVGFDVRTGKRVFEVGDELDAVLAADINNNHTLIALGGPSKVVRVFSTADGSVVQEIRKHTDWIYAVEFSPDGVLLATADRSAGLFVWESDTAREYQNLSGHKGAVTDVSWRLDSNVLASSSEDGTVKLWEMENGTVIKTLQAHAGGVTSINFARDGRLASVGRDQLTKVWDPAGNVVRTFEAFDDIGLKTVFTLEGKRVVAGDWLGDIRVWDVADGKLVGKLSDNPPTLELNVQIQSAAVAAAGNAAKQAASELAAAEANVVASTTALNAANQAVAAADTNVKQLAAAKATNEALVPKKADAVRDLTGTLTQAKAALEKAKSEQTNLDRLVAQRRTAAAGAEDRLKAAKLAADKAAAEQDAVRDALAKATAAVAASDGAAAKAKAAADEAQARLADAEQALVGKSGDEKETAEKAVAEAKTAVKSMSDELTKCVAESRAAAALLTAANKAAEQKAGVAKTAGDALAAVGAASEKAAKEKADAEKQAADKGTAVTAAAEALAAAQRQLDKETLELAAIKKARKRRRGASSGGGQTSSPGPNSGQERGHCENRSGKGAGSQSGSQQSRRRRHGCRRGHAAGRDRRQGGLRSNAVAAGGRHEVVQSPLAAQRHPPGNPIPAPSAKDTLLPRRPCRVDRSPTVAATPRRACGALHAACL